MGYTTTFRGRLDLDRALSDEHAALLRRREIHDDLDGPGGYLQWVPTSDLRGIEWDGGEKFRGYVPWLQYLARKLGEWGYNLSGTLLWQGEQAGDVGRLVVEDNQVTVEPWEHNPRVGAPEKPRIEQLLDCVRGGGDGYEVACAELRAALTSAQREVLGQLVRSGPVWDGDVVSKSARDDLLRWGLASRAHYRGEQGYTVANYLGGHVHGAARGEPPKQRELVRVDREGGVTTFAYRDVKEA